MPPCHGTGYFFSLEVLKVSKVSYFSSFHDQKVLKWHWLIFTPFGALEERKKICMFLDLYIYFFSYFATCQRKENDWHSSFSYKKNAFPFYLYPFIVFHISVWSERFLDKFPLLELRISPIMYLIFHNCIMNPKYYMKIIVPFWPFIWDALLLLTKW